MSEKEDVNIKLSFVNSEVDSLKKSQEKTDDKIEELRGNVGEIKTGVAVLQNTAKDTREDIASISAKIDLMNYVPREEIDRRFELSQKKHDDDILFIHSRVDKIESVMRTVNDKIETQGIEIASTPWKTHIKNYTFVFSILGLIGSVIYWVMVAYSGHVP